MNYQIIRLDERLFAVKNTQTNRIVIRSAKREQLERAMKALNQKAETKKKK